MSLIIAYKEDKNIINVISDSRTICGHHISSNNCDKVLTYNISFLDDDGNTKERVICMGVTGYSKLINFIKYLRQSNELDVDMLNYDNINTSNIDLFITNILKKYIAHYQIKEDCIPTIEAEILTIIDNRIFNSVLCSDFAIDTYECEMHGTAGAEYEVSTALMDLNHDPIDIFRYVCVKNFSIGFPLNKITINFDNNSIYKTVIEQ